MSDIKRLLNKKGWTGKELGQIELSNMAYTFGQQIEGKEPTPLVSHADFRKMLNTLKDPVQIRAYNGYVSIHEWLSVAYNITSGQEQQAQSNFKTLLNYITVAQAIEKTYGYIEQLPVIMTEKQYREYKERRIKEITEPPEEAPMAFNLFNALIEATESLVNQLQTHPRKPNPLKALKPKLKKERVKDPRILSRYNEVMGNGYYTLDETGQRSDTMTAEEWQEAVALPEIDKALTFKEDGKIHPTVFTRIQEVAKATFRGASEEELKEIEKKYSLLKPTTFHLYEEPPKDLNKWEILQTGDLFAYYRSLESKSPEGEELDNDEDYIQATIADIEAFKSEFPQVFDAVLNDMRKYMGDTVDTPIEEWATTMFSWADLHRVGFYDFDKTYLDDVALYAGSKRMIVNGVAVLQEGSFTEYSIDSNGYYKTPNILADLTPFSLTALFTDDPNYATTAKELEDARETLLDSYYFMLGFNEAIDLISKYFGVPQLEVFKFKTDIMANRMEAFNTITAMLYKEIQERDRSV